MMYRIDSGVCALPVETLRSILNCLSPLVLSSNSAAATDCFSSILDLAVLNQAARLKNHHGSDRCANQKSVVSSGNLMRSISYRQEQVQSIV